MNKRVEEAIWLVTEGYDPYDVVDHLYEAEFARGGIFGPGGPFSTEIKYTSGPLGGVTRRGATIMSMALGVLLGTIIGKILVKVFRDKGIVNESLKSAQKKINEWVVQNNVTIEKGKVKKYIAALAKDPSFISSMKKHALAADAMVVSKASRKEYCNRLGDTIAQRVISQLNTAREMKVGNLQLSGVLGAGGPGGKVESMTEMSAGAKVGVGAGLTALAAGLAYLLKKWYDKQLVPLIRKEAMIKIEAWALEKKYDLSTGRAKTLINRFIDSDELEEYIERYKDVESITGRPATARADYAKVVGAKVAEYVIAKMEEAVDPAVIDVKKLYEPKPKVVMTRYGVPVVTRGKKPSLDPKRMFSRGPNKSTVKQAERVSNVAQTAYHTARAAEAGVKTYQAIKGIYDLYKGSQKADPTGPTIDVKNYTIR